MPPGLTSPFTFEERKWIILKFGELKSATLVRRAFRVKPNSIEDLKSVVNDFAHAMDPDLIKKVCSCARSKFEKIRTQRGGHFEQL